MSDKYIKLIIIVSVPTVALSLFYYLVIRPIHNGNELGKCLERAESQRYYEYEQDYRDNCFRQF